MIESRKILREKKAVEEKDSFMKHGKRKLTRDNDDFKTFN
jgi:hypothetical protein